MISFSETGIYCCQNRNQIRLNISQIYFPGLNSQFTCEFALHMWHIIIFTIDDSRVVSATNREDKKAIISKKETSMSIAPLYQIALTVSISPSTLPLNAFTILSFSLTSISNLCMTVNPSIKCALDYEAVPPIIPGPIRDSVCLSDKQIICNLRKGSAHAKNRSSWEIRNDSAICLLENVGPMSNWTTAEIMVYRWNGNTFSQNFTFHVRLL